MWLRLRLTSAEDLWELIAADVFEEVYEWCCLSFLLKRAKHSVIAEMLKRPVWEPPDGDEALHNLRTADPRHALILQFSFFILSFQKLLYVLNRLS